jgi:GNAT superfamily N-acetyltransferase
LNWQQVLRFSRLPDDCITGFDCSIGRLNDFLKSALFYDEAYLAVTFLAKHVETNELLGYFTLASDCIVLDEREIDRFWLAYAIKQSKYPAVKIGRIAVKTELQGQGLGHELVTVIVGIARRMQRSVGVRFLSVDANDDVTGFYRQLDFVNNCHENEIANHTTSMRYDLSENIWNEEDDDF